MVDTTKLTLVADRNTQGIILTLEGENRIASKMLFDFLTQDGLSSPDLGFKINSNGNIEFTFPNSGNENEIFDRVKSRLAEIESVLVATGSPVKLDLSKINDDKLNFRELAEITVVRRSINKVIADVAKLDREDGIPEPKPNTDLSTEKLGTNKLKPEGTSGEVSLIEVAKQGNADAQSNLENALAKKPIRKWWIRRLVDAVLGGGEPARVIVNPFENSSEVVSGATLTSATALLEPAKAVTANVGDSLTAPTMEVSSTETVGNDKMRSSEPVDLAAGDFDARPESSIVPQVITRPVLYHLTENPKKKPVITKEQTIAEVTDKIYKRCYGDSVAAPENLPQPELQVDKAMAAIFAKIPDKKTRLRKENGILFMEIDGSQLTVKERGKMARMFKSASHSPILDGQKMITVNYGPISKTQKNSKTLNLALADFNAIGAAKKAVLAQSKTTGLVRS